MLEQWRDDNEPEPAALLARWRELAARGRQVDMIDEVTTGSHLQLTGKGWHMADDARNYQGGCYWTDPSDAGRQPNTATWRLDNPLLGRYRISIWYGGLPEGGVATDAPYTVKTRHGGHSFKVDQTQKTGQWNELGVFEDPVRVIQTNQAGGRVIVDAVKFERLD